MPLFGLGTLFVKELPHIIYEAIKAGVRLFDTAYVYQNEKQVGEGVNKAINDGLVKREELFIITKIWSTWKHDPEAGLRAQLKNLDLDYVDLYLDHAPVWISVNPEGVMRSTPLHIFWKNMENLVTLGLTKSIGVCNYNVQMLDCLLAVAEIKPVVNQFEEHPYLTQKGLVNYCKTHDVAIMAYNTMGKNFYVEKFHKDANLSLIDDKVVVDMATKLGKSPGLILINWAISSGFIVIPSTSNPERFKENMQALTFRMSPEDIETINKMNIPYRFGTSTNTVGSGGIDIYA